MTTSYPGAIDSLTNPTPSDTLNSATVPHAAQHANLNDAMEAVQATLGTNPQGTSSTVKDRIAAAEGAIINLNLAVDERVPGESGSNQPGGTLPNGYVWVNTTTNAIKVWNGTQFVDPSNGGGGTSAAGLTLITAQSFTTASAVNINNCFTSTYANYRIIITATISTAAQLRYRYRLSGTDNAAAGSYTGQRLRAEGTTLNGDAPAYDYANVVEGAGSTTWRGYIDVYGPAVATNTHSIGVAWWSQPGVGLTAVSHAVATAYDGITFYPSSGTVTGAVRIYGYQDN